MYQYVQQQVASTRAGRAVGWAVVALALSMVLAIAAEALRAGTREGIHFVAPAILGFGLAGLTALSRRHWHRLLAWPRPGRVLLVAIILIPLVVQLVVIAGVRTVPASDWASYWASAERLLNEGTYVCRVGEGLEFRAHKPPGQAIYLALVQAIFGKSVLAAQLLNVLLIVSGNLLFYAVVRRQGCRVLALCATAVFAFWPARNFSAALLSYDAPASFMVVLFWLLADGPPHQRWPRSLAAGVAAGAAAMLRQTLLMLPVAFVLYR